MKIARNVLIGIAIILLLAGAGVFYYSYYSTSPTGNIVAASQPNTNTSGTVRTVYARIEHSSGYYFTGDAATDPTTIAVNKGDTVQIITNDLNPTHNHGITIDAFGINQVTSSDPTITFVANQAGTFKIYCGPCVNGPLGAHPWMVGTLIVNP